MSLIICLYSSFYFCLSDSVPFRNTLIFLQVHRRQLFSRYQVFIAIIWSFFVCLFHSSLWAGSCSIVFLQDIWSADVELMKYSSLLLLSCCKGQRSQLDTVNDWQVCDQIWSAETLLSFCSDGSALPSLSLSLCPLYVDVSLPSVTVGLYTLFMKSFYIEVTGVCVCVCVVLCCILTFHGHMITWK